MDREPYRWVTVKGAHIPIYKDENGQDVFGVGREDLKSDDEMIKMVVGESDNYFSERYKQLNDAAWSRFNEKEKIKANIDKLKEELKKEKSLDAETAKELKDSGIAEYAFMFEKPTEKGKAIEKQIKELEEHKNRIHEEYKHYKNQLDEYNRTERMKQQNEWLQRISTNSTMTTPKENYVGFETNRSTTGRVDEALKKGYAEVVEMSPKEYLERANYQIFQQYTLAQNVGGRSYNLVNEYAKMIREGTKFHTPYLDYEYGEQEGIHRAMAAMLNQQNKIPVIIVHKRR